MKKTILSIFYTVALAVNLMAQSCVPDYIHLTAVARNGNVPVTYPIDVKVELSVGDLDHGGVLVYGEQDQNIQPNAVGEFSLDFGNPTLITNPPAVLMNAVNWTSCNIWYRLSFRKTGDPTYTPIVSASFTSVPYAFHARTAENITVPATTGQVLKYNGTKWVAGSDNTGSSGYTAGSGINISGSTISSTVTGVPVGTVLPFAGITVPNGFLLCNGAPISKATYADLHAVIGTAWGSGDGVTTFNLPDMRGMFLRGVAGTSTVDPDKTTRVAANPGGNTGNNVGSRQGNAVQSHTHLDRHLGSQTGSVPGYLAYTGTLSNALGSSPSGGNETRPVNVYVNYIIKY